MKRSAPPERAGRGLTGYALRAMRLLQLGANGNCARMLLSERKRRRELSIY